MRRGSGARYRTPAVLQMDETECGAASLAMILGYYGRFEPLEILREDCGVTRNGSKASLILAAARSRGMKASGFMVPPEDLEDLRCPVIIYWDQSHYLVYEGRSRSGDRIFLNDPAGGHRITDWETFCHRYSGIALVCTPEASFKKTPRRESALAVFRELLRGMERPGGLALWSGVLALLTGFAAPALLQIFADSVLTEGDGRMLVPLLAVFGSAVILAAVFNLTQELLLRRMTLFVSVNRTAGLFRHMFRMPSLFFSGRSSGELQRRLSMAGRSSAAYVRLFLENLISAVSAVFFALLMLLYSPALSLAAFGAALAGGLIMSWAAASQGMREQRDADQRSAYYSTLGLAVEELEDIRLAGGGSWMFASLADSFAALASRSSEGDGIRLLARRLPDLMTLLSVLVLAYPGSLLVIRGAVSPGELTAFMLVFTLFFRSMLRTSGGWTRLGYLRAGLHRIFEAGRYPPAEIFASAEAAAGKEAPSWNNLAETEDQPGDGLASPELDPPDNWPSGAGQGAGSGREQGSGEAAGAGVEDGPGAVLREEAPFPGSLLSMDPVPLLEFREVCFAYGRDSERVLDRISFRIMPGTRVAVVGASGSGKSTLARIAAGLLSPESGTVLFRGRPLSAWREEEFRESVGYVDQLARPFSGTMAENISLYDPSCNPRIMLRAVRDACMEEELLFRGSPATVNVAENGRNFSGGQCQRMEIARALASGAGFLILDEATSALDRITEAAVDQSLDRRCLTLLIIAHRLATVRHADEILVLERGRVAERGSWSELMDRGGIFRRMMLLEGADRE